MAFFGEIPWGPTKQQTTNKQMKKTQHLEVERSMQKYDYGLPQQTEFRV